MTCAKRIEAHDRRWAALHEAGHLVVAHHLGVPTKDARIFRLGEPSREDKSWGGNIGIDCAAPPDKLRLVAVAGAIAEAVWTGEEPDFYDPATMSPTDWQWAGVEPGDSDTLLDAADIVSGLLQPGGRLWPDLVREARQLIVQARQARAHA
jgi:hypothetical protein